VHVNAIIGKMSKMWTKKNKIQKCFFKDNVNEIFEGQTFKAKEVLLIYFLFFLE